MNDYQFSTGMNAIGAIETMSELDKFKKALEVRETQLEAERKQRILNGDEMEGVLSRCQRTIENAADEVYKGEFDSQVDSVYFALKNSSAIELLKQQGCEVILPPVFEMQDSLVEFTLDDLNCYHLQQTEAGDIIIPISL